MSIRTLTYCDVCKMEVNETSKKVVQEPDKSLLQTILGHGGFCGREDFCEACASAIIIAAVNCAKNGGSIPKK